MKNNRLEIIKKVFLFSKDLKSLGIELKEFNFDYDGKKITLHKQIILDLFDKYINNLLDYEYMSKWADLIELRDEIEYEYGFEDIISEIISILSTPEINGKLDVKTINLYIDKLK